MWNTMLQPPKLTLPETNSSCFLASQLLKTQSFNLQNLLEEGNCFLGHHQFFSLQYATLVMYLNNHNGSHSKKRWSKKKHEKAQGPFRAGYRKFLFTKQTKIIATWIFYVNCNTSTILGNKKAFCCGSLHHLIPSLGLTSVLGPVFSKLCCHQVSCNNLVSISLARTGCFTVLTVGTEQKNKHLALRTSHSTWYQQQNSIFFLNTKHLAQQQKHERIDTPKSCHNWKDRLLLPNHQF